MRIAAIADMHSNYAALEAVLADIGRQGVDHLVCLGDMASGPLDARRTLDMLMALDMTVVLGNHDRYLLDRPRDEMGAWDKIALDQLDAQHLDWLRAIPATRVLDGEVFLCHATPSNDETYWLETVNPDGAIRMSDLAAIEAGAEGIAQSLILCAHTHIPRAVRLRDGRLIVNPGSAGCPGYRDKLPYPHLMQTGTPDASYAILDRRDGEWQVSLRLIPYDHAAMAALARQNGMAAYADTLASGWVKPAA
ncbi:Metallophosphoesterase [Rhodopseudomonas palustris HaA2]|uniref:Metallophosphoesterase n=1 Tax=Rhodopseudomonas palustris (strain HaA2) TaxID=316058 RepID=Q2J2G8_RHOP2|nr:metallophosphoesterase family protein [Rhodopseudomonas palustris]ABD05342.1 Metallophosphoesterase [Rhodopseudomonas palustris HaA2]